jgi:hypothetical protein
MRHAPISLGKPIAYYHREVTMSPGDRRSFVMVALFNLWLVLIHHFTAKGTVVNRGAKP